MTATFDVHARQRIWSPLAAEEIPVVVNAVSDASDRLDAIDSRIQSLEEELNRLQIQKDVTRRHLDAHRSLQAPIRSLPLELLSEILFLCTDTLISYQEDKNPIEDTLDPASDSEPYDDDIEYLTTGTTDIYIPQVTLSKVCSTWNSVIDASTYAWSNISFTLQLSETPPYVRPFKLAVKRIGRIVARVIERSGNSPLHVSIVYSTESDREIGSEFLSVLTHLLRQCHRWKRAKVSLDFAPIDHPLFLELNSLMPILESLSFSLASNEYPLVVQGMAHTGDDHYFGFTPSLQNAVINSALALERSQVKWANLRTLALGDKWAGDSPSVSLVKSILSECKALHTLVWKIGLVDGSDNDTEPVVLSVTSIVGNESTAELLPHLHLPQLQTFDLVAERRYQPSVKTVLSNLDSYRSKITSLTCQGMDQIWSLKRSIEEIFAELGNMPALQKLTLTRRFRDVPVSNIAVIPSRFPMLKSLTCNLLGGKDADSALSPVWAFKRPELADTSSDADFPVLRKVYLNLSDIRLKEEQILALKGFKAGGLLFSVRDQTGYLEI